MTALIIIVLVLSVIICFLNFPVYADIRYYGGKADIRIKYLWLTLYPRPDPPEKENEEKQKNAPPKKTVKTQPAKKSYADKEKVVKKTPSDKKSGDPPKAETKKKGKSVSEDKSKGKGKAKKKPPEKKKPLFERISDTVNDLTEKKDAALLLWELIKDDLVKLGKKISIDGLKLDFACADEDAYEAAMTYGRVSAVVYDLLAAVKCVIKVKVDFVKINCLFNVPADKSRYDGECKIMLRPASLLNALCAILFGFLVGYKKYNPALEVFIKK